MLKVVFLITSVVILSLFSFTTYNAYADVYLKISSIKGDVIAQGFTGDIHLSSLQFGVGRGISSLTGGSTDREASVPTLSDLVITKQMDVSSSVFVKDLLGGQSIPTAEIFLTNNVNGHQFTYTTITLSNVLISGYSTSSSGDNPTENISLNYEKISTEFIPQNSNGSPGQPITSCWDIVQGGCTAAVLDITPPTTTAVLSGTVGTNNWYVSPVSVTLSATDNTGGSGVQSTTYSLDGGPQTTYSTPFTVTGDSNHTLTFNSTDNAGNVESPNTLHIAIDTTPPVTTDTPSGTTGNNGWYVSPVSVTLSATDDLSGVAATSYSLDGDSHTTYSTPFTITGDGNHTLTFNSTDNAGNQEVSNTRHIAIDTTPPVVTGTANMTVNANGWYKHPLQVSWTGTDATSGVASCNTATVYSGPDGSAIAIVGHCTDNAGNIGSGTITIKYDSTPPVLKVPSDVTTVFPTSASGAVVTFSNTNGTAASATDETSGVQSITYSPPSGSTFPIGTTTVTVTATDNAGNMATGTFKVTVLTPAQASQQVINNTGSANLDKGTTTSLDAKLQAAISSLNSVNNNTAKNQLNAFINAVNAQSGKKITTAEASQLITEAQDIINSIH